MNAISTDLPKVANYRAIELIHESDRTLVYRGIEIENGQPVVMKLMRNKYPSFNELVKFRNQYAIMLRIADANAKNLDMKGIIKTYALECYENRYALIMEDIGGVSLAEYKGKISLSIPQFLDIAIQLADILHYLHQNKIIHKDIKPANILIHPETQQVKLIDFSISTLLPRETQTIQTLNILEGTLAYLSPEQTGRMNRSIDYRSDFYSLGVTFYELLTGNVPFASDDTLELIHAHIAQNPDPPSKWISLEGKFCPIPLSNIVLKLMAKNAEDRYQSALGLKYDLEQCLSYYQETKEITAFELGERDIGDRFIIPEKLYGREKEVQKLLNAFERITSPPTPLGQEGGVGRAEMILVAGFSGIGKTAVINEVHKPIVRQRGYFIKGKFDQFNRNIPFSAFVQAFRSLMGQILGESDAELQVWKTKILAAVGNNGQVLIDVIPELEIVISQQPPVPELSGSAAQNRFNLLFEKFIAVFTTKEHPLVIFLDDLQWVDSASLNLMKVLMGDSKTGYLLVLGAYRDNEVFPAHPLMLTLAELAKKEAAISTITLAPLSLHYINALVAETLGCQAEQSQLLAELVYQKTQGNPFFTTQFLKGLHADELIVFNLNLGYWECDLVKIRDAALTDDVVKFMVGRLQKLPAATQEVLKLAACIGNQFDLETLAIVCEKSSEEVASEIWHALREGTILPISEAYKFFQSEIESPQSEIAVVEYRFLHDRVQQAAYSLIREEQKKALHLQIGKLLSDDMQIPALGENIFDIVNQLNIGRELLLLQSERDRLLRLNYIAGEKAKHSTAYTAATEYFEIALELRRKNCWEKEWELTFNLHLEVMEVAYLHGDFDRVEQFAKILLEKAKTPLEIFKIYEIKILAYESQNKALEAIEMTLPFLREFNIELPRNPSPEDIGQSIQAVRSHLQDKSIADLVNLPQMSDRVELAALRMLLSLSTASYLALPALTPIIISRAVCLSIERGNSVNAAFAYSGYALILCGIVGDIELGSQFGELALALLPQFEDKSIQVKTLQTISVFVTHWRSHLQNASNPLLQAYTIGLETGELNFASLSVFVYCYHSYFLGTELHQLIQEMDTYNRVLINLKQNQTLLQNKIFQQAVINLVEATEHPCNLSGRAYDETQYISLHKKANETSTLGYVYLNKLILHYLFGEFDLAIEQSRNTEQYLDGMMGRFLIPIFHFYKVLAWLGHYSTAPDREREKLFLEIEESEEKLKQWAHYAPMNFLHKSDLIRAEKQHLLGEKCAAIESYDRAIAEAKENGYIQEEALANELAAKFYLDWGKEKFAALHLQEAYYCYAQWGAKAKTNDLEKRYPQLLKPILERDRASSSQISISRITSHSHSQTATVANISLILDFSSLLKASQTLSREIELDRLLSKLMKTILENAGATKGALLLTSETGLMIEAISTRTDTEKELKFDSLHQSIPLEDYPDLPIGLINTVRRTTEIALLDANAAQTQFAVDNYLLRFSPQSLLCLPLLERGNLIGVLYLENSLTADVFTKDRVDLLDTLCAQAAISLTNARLYQQAQRALTDLQQAQLQLVQNEKMATLGNLVAGVAHEINNPLGFIGGNVKILQDYLADLSAIIEGYREEYPEPSPQLAEEIEELDLDFLLEDLPKIIASMQEGVKRIDNISTSLRTFSRTDADKKTEFNLHEGIDSTLLILKYRLKANEQRPAIAIMKNYGEIPEVKCYPGQINQVFMNLLANAIDALDESNEGKTYTEIETALNCITITTELNEEKKRAIVRIADNGTGMLETVKAKIFGQGFTTKEVGKGTGLGMAIAKQIITEKHGGAIACQSELGKGTEFVISLPFN